MLTLTYLIFFYRTAYFLTRVCEKAPWHVTSFWLLGNALVVVYLDTNVNMYKNEKRAAIKYLYLKGLTRNQISVDMRYVLGDYAPSLATVIDGLLNFNEVEYRLNNVFRT